MTDGQLPDETVRYPRTAFHGIAIVWGFTAIMWLFGQTDFVMIFGISGVVTTVLFAAAVYDVNFRGESRAE